MHPTIPSTHSFPVAPSPRRSGGGARTTASGRPTGGSSCGRPASLKPDLRDDKTPLFEELESQLLGTDLNTQAVLDAYDQYLKGFAELAHLTISGSYHEFGDGDVMHLFGVTAEDPPVHYYRTIRNIGLTKPDAGIEWGP